MKTENNKSAENVRRYIAYIISYIAICIIILSAAVLVMNNLIKKNTENQMNETIGLIAEKVNVSFDMMSKYVVQEANILSVQENLDFGEEYKMLQNLDNDMDFISIGLVDKNGRYYCKDGEKIDIEKYEFDKDVVGNEELYITEPYFSCVTGSNVLTMFAPVFQENEYAGNLFVTYPLECVQNLAQTNVLKHEVESFLMNSITGNYITCSNSANHTAGIWKNLTLMKGQITCSDGYDCDRWLENMYEDSDDNLLCYEMGQVIYTQSYVKINSMDNWFVVVRIPSTMLTNAMHQYLFCVGVCAGILILFTIILAFLLYFNEYRQKKKVEHISQYDALTNLMNRMAFGKKLGKIFENEENIRNCVYIFVDIDYFKEINDTYGHAVGDEILQKVAKIMNEVFSNYGYTARIGGDEFNIFIEDMKNNKDVEKLISSYQQKIADIVLDDGTALPVQCSIGAARYISGEDDLSSLTLHADEALYFVKRNGKNSLCWYSSELENEENK